ncbi:uncharacterized protein [Phyllobates terribilis]|uniref:uncharacterized protein isoform X1 n=1 Tax=Phyllobates terribilis TaxID=111132 RepID=UPI003CCA7A1D
MAAAGRGKEKLETPELGGEEEGEEEMESDEEEQEGGSPEGTGQSSSEEEDERENEAEIQRLEEQVEKNPEIWDRASEAYKGKQRLSPIIEALTTLTLNLMDRATNEDDLDKFGLSIAGRLRSMPRDKQNLYMTAANPLVMAIDGPSPMSSAPGLITGIFNLFNPSGSPPAAATQRFGQVAASPPEPCEATATCVRPPAHGASGHRPGPSPNTSFS